MNKFHLVTLAILLLVACDNNANKFDATGAFEATEVIVSSEANGKIIEFNIQEGETINAGDYLGYIDSIQLYLKKKQISASLKAIDIQKPDIHKQIAAIEQQISTARTEQQRMKNLVDAKAGNQKQLDDITNQIQLLLKQLDAQKSTLDKTSTGMDAESESIIYQVMQLDDQLQKCRIISPVTGTVLAKYVETGEITAIGKPLFRIANISLLYLRVYITADQLSGLKIGQSIKVFAGYEENLKEYTGTVTWVSSKAEFTPKGIQTKNEKANLVYAIKVAVKNDGYLKIGQYGEININ